MKIQLIGFQVKATWAGIALNMINIYRDLIKKYITRIHTNQINHLRADTHPPKANISEFHAGC